ncbi:MAG: cbb3-type cytochrome c oxidase subunit I [Verrucomicrobia bacterium]|nr:cbb3-type cytochrome c oxidase subunit I [Verrucomicrobiota bacterium]
MLATYHYNQYIVAATHLFVLGFVASVLMGAWYRHLPDKLAVRLHSERLARWHLALHLVGVAGMVWMFWVWNLKQVGHFGSVFAGGVALGVYNLARTLGRARPWNPAASAVASALLWLSLGVLAGLVLATAKCEYESLDRLSQYPVLGQLVHWLAAVAQGMRRFDALSAMHAHAHLGIVGCFLMLILALAALPPSPPTAGRLAPLAETRARWSVRLLNVGLLGLGIALWLRSPWKTACGVLVAVALLLYASEVRAQWTPRPNAGLGWEARCVLTAVWLMVPVALLGLFLSWPGLPATPLTTQLENVYGFLGLAGVVTLALFGLIRRILPPREPPGRAGPAGQPLGPADLPGSARPAVALCQFMPVAGASYGLWMAGLAATAGATAASSEAGVRVGATLLLVASLGFALSLRPSLRPTLRPPAIAPGTQSGTCR